MIAVLLLLLLVVWAAVLIPPWLRSRMEHSPGSSIQGFHHRLSVLASRSGVERPLPGFTQAFPQIPPPASYGMVPARTLRQSEAQRRRTLILEGLLIVGACTLVLGLLPPLRFFMVLFVLDIVALAGYIALLLQWKRNRLEHRTKVRDIRPLHPVPQFATAGGGTNRSRGAALPLGQSMSVDAVSGRAMTANGYGR